MYVLMLLLLLISYRAKMKHAKKHPFKSAYQLKVKVERDVCARKILGDAFIMLNLVLFGNSIK